MKGLVAVFLFAFTLAVLHAATVPSDFVDTQWVTGLSRATAMDFAPDGRLFVCQQDGALRVIKNGKLLAEPFVTLKVNNAGERGLLGIAFDPNFVSNQYLYVYYTATLPAHNRISRLTANGDVALLNSEVILLDMSNPSDTWQHNGGAIHFGPDGKLYAAVGDNSTPSHGQSLNNLFGKILRMNPDPADLIPADNPFVNQASGVNRAIWALGLRNPFTFAFQPGTGRMFINDVGDTQWEEINDGVAGGNYGWPNSQGDHNDPRYARPILAYAHGWGPTTGNAVAGGAFYNPRTPQFPPEYVGRYFFADAISHWVQTLDPANNNAVTGFGNGYLTPVDVKVGPDGALYVLARDSFCVHRVTYTQNEPPSITTQPANRTATIGQTTTFSVVASGTDPLAYQWQRNSVNISGATQASYTTPPVTTNDNGSLFRCVVTNPFGAATSDAASLTATSNKRPTGTITAPAVSRLYEGGQRINFAGTATDPEDGALPGSAFSWLVQFHHDDGSPHFHPVRGPQSGKTGFFDVPRTGEVSPNVFFRITLTVADSAGVTHVSTRDVYPRKVMLTLTAVTSTGDPALTLKLDDQPIAEPYTFQAVSGMTRTIGAPSPQSVSGATYVFQSWSDFGEQRHTITVPTSDKTYTAQYRISANP